MACVKAEELRRLAREFRAKATETEMREYIAMMKRSAAELEQFADEIEGRDADCCAAPLSHQQAR